MTSCERVLTAMSFHTPDRLPRFDSFWPEIYADYRSQLGLGADVDLTDYFGNDISIAAADERPFREQLISKTEEETIRRDGWGSLVRTHSGSTFWETLEPCIQRAADLDKPFVPAEEPYRYERFQKYVQQEKAKGKAVFAKIGGPYCRSTFMRTQEEYLADLLVDTEFAKTLAEKVAAHLLQIALASLQIGDLYDTGVWIYDDMAYNELPQFSPNVFRQVFLPIYADLVHRIKAAGARYVILHSDGNIAPFLDMLIEVGINGINPVEPRAGLEVPALRKRYGDRLVLIGGMCNSLVLPNGPPAEIRKQASAIVAAGREGGVIIGTHSVGPDIPLSHYMAYNEVVVNEGCYCTRDSGRPSPVPQ